MSRPTIADLANAAGVSLSTVNRLLHGNGTVRADTIDRIVEAADQIGFYGLGALQRRKRENLPHRKLTFLMQQSHRPLYQLWAEGIRSAAERRSDAVIDPRVVFEDDLTPEAVSAKLLKLGDTSDAIAVVTADHPLVSQAIDELRSKGVPVIAYVTDLSAASRAGFVGTDNWKRGRTAAWFINKTAKNTGKVFPLVGSNRYQCQDIADASFRSYMREHCPDFQVHETLMTHEVPENAYQLVKGLVATEPDLCGIFVNGGGISGVLRAMREIDPGRKKDICLVCSDIGPETRKGLTEGLITASLAHPLDRMPQELIDVMLRLIERKDTPSIEQRIVPFDILTPESIWT
ncbi:LacI family DNA-binding transcriptional regulator [Agrobacterium tumefaciens]|uniref:LacI family DNA-binding transcriptional regulator n=1 Tax=Agrobacterium tumefaciens TaxID=358 RepID=UPI00080FA138|nr:LacI family DNA-binding transcriptional regulator [Agrobacterium tumefaciens]NSY52061.1 LacI family DNA-binding transcriptional regulator [Agrobacterium tumefaciens]NTC81655.1 LacI family DNA-binding transcriptional regulator [Agrobacterium tumefaciens]NTD11236.1 LacI family DNA-binding transcriptional regulator [Agrobacterium tumefaciens]OCJ62980.1 LacI family transcriptional regulator [Agrobacterium tumefaciens]WCK16723.1 LacI family DNA-binding transcriptional regulator [Agrobacterium tu